MRDLLDIIKRYWPRPVGWSIVSFVGPLPGEFRLGAAEVPIDGGLAVDGPEHIQGADHGFGLKGEMGPDQLLDLVLVNLGCAE